MFFIGPTGLKNFVHSQEVKYKFSEHLKKLKVKEDNGYQLS